jgi:hypothetical protein
MIKEGDKFRSTFTGLVYRVKEIKDAMVLLETENGSLQTVTDKSSIKLFYQNEEKKEGKRVFFEPLPTSLNLYPGAEGKR